MVDNKLGIDRQLDSFRAMRRDIEASVLPLATSLDGRRFTFQASLYALQLQVGGYAVLADAAFAQAVFSFVPPGLIERSATFRQGEGLIAGKISPEPALLRFGARITEEGGADVPAIWASPR